MTGRRVKAQVMVAFLADALCSSGQPCSNPTASAVENAQPFSPMKAISWLSTLPTADIALPPALGENPSSPCHRTLSGTEDPSPPTRPQRPRTFTLQLEIECRFRGCLN